MKSSKVAKNPARRVKRLFENIPIILAQSRICSPLIDVLQIELYNVHMEEDTVQTLVAFEISQPAKKLNRSAGALLFLLIALVLFIILAANLLSTALEIPRETIQLPLYALLLAASYFVYLRHFVCYRYTLTNQTFAVDRISGNKERALFAILLSDMEVVLPDDETRVRSKHVIYASVFPKRRSIRMNATLDGHKTVFFLSPSEEFYATLQAQVQRHAERESI